MGSPKAGSPTLIWLSLSPLSSGASSGLEELDLYPEGHPGPSHSAPGHSWGESTSRTGCLNQQKHRKHKRGDCELFLLPFSSLLLSCPGLEVLPGWGCEPAQPSPAGAERILCAGKRLEALREQRGLCCSPSRPRPRQCLSCFLLPREKKRLPKPARATLTLPFRKKGGCKARLANETQVHTPNSGSGADAATDPAEKRNWLQSVGIRSSS